MNQGDDAPDGMSPRCLGDRQAMEGRQRPDLVQLRPLPHALASRGDEEAVHCGARQARRGRRCQEALGIEARLDNEVEGARTAAESTEDGVVPGTQARAGLDQHWRPVSVFPDELGVGGSVSDLESIEHADGMGQERFLPLPLVGQELHGVVEDAFGRSGGGR